MIYCIFCAEPYELYKLNKLMQTHYKDLHSHCEPAGVAISFSIRLLCYARNDIKNSAFALVGKWPKPKT